MSEREPPTPTLDRIAELREQLDTIGEFLEWLHDKRKIVLAEYREETWTCEHCGRVPKEETAVVPWSSADDSEPYRHQATFCKAPMEARTYWPDIMLKCHVEYMPAGLYPSRAGIEELLHQFFEIDPTAVERERRALLAACREPRSSTKRED